MIHTRYDLAGAKESAIKAVKKTGTVRYVVRTAIGLTIERQRPQGAFYQAWRVDETGVWEIHNESMDM